MEAIENKELQGISLKSLYSLIVATAIIVAFVVGMQNRTSNQIERIAEAAAWSVKFNEVRFTALKQDLELQGLKIKELEQKYNQLLVRLHGFFEAIPQASAVRLRAGICVWFRLCRA